jgi:thioredoxin 1
MVVELKTIEEFANAINVENKLVIVDFFTHWCGPCKAIAPRFAKLAEKYPMVGFYKIDADNNDLSEVTEACMIKSLPTFCYFINGKFITSITGANDKEIEKFIIDLSQKTETKVEPEQKQ